MQNSHCKLAAALSITFLLAACGSAGSPDQAVESYLRALVNTDEIAAVNASCAAWEGQAILESAAYQGVEAQLEGLDCQVVSQDGETARVACHGQIRYSYAGGEDQLDELGGRLFSVVVEGGEWKMCGPGGPQAGAFSTGEASSTPDPVTQQIPTETPFATEPVWPSATPTPDTRLLPKEWRTWPIVPALSPWLADVYERGLTQGNDPTHFAKAGDCQNIPEAFLGFYDIPGRYRLDPDEEYLRETIDYYAGSWGRDGVALDGGFNFPAIFTPLRADPDICEQGEDPLACEIRTYKPSFIIISMEFVYEGRTSQNYEEYLRQAVDYALSQNVIPILITKADNVEGNHSINLATAQVAYDYDIPLINWWRAAQPLAGHGIDWARNEGKRPEGFYITYKSWSVRSYFALKTLDALRRALIEFGVGG